MSSTSDQDDSVGTSGGAGGAGAGGGRRLRASLFSSVSSESHGEEGSDFDTLEGLPSKQKPKKLKNQVLSTLPSTFYDPSFSAVDYLKGLFPPEGVSDAWMENQIVEMGMAREIVEKELAARIVESYDDFVQGMAEIGELGEDLRLAARLCRSGRENLVMAKKGLADSYLRLLSLHRKTILIQTVLHHVKAIKDLKDTERKLQEALEIGDYPSAIHCTLEAQKALPLFKHFVCIRGLSDSLEDSMGLVETKLNAALQNVCRDFHPDRYEKIITGFKLLGKTFQVHNVIQRHFSRTIESNCKNIVYAHVLQTDSRPELLKTMEYPELCQGLREDHFLPCLKHLLEVNCDVMFVHWRISRWHQEYEASHAAEGTGGKFAEIKNALAEIGKTMWEDAQKQIAILLNSPQFANFKVDTFLQVLESVHKYIEFGEAFSNSPARWLSATLNRQSRDHFVSLHSSILSDLKTLLENEMWIPIPVSENYTIRNIPEFQAFLDIPPSRLQRMRDAKDTKRSPEVIFMEFIEQGNPCASKPAARQLGEAAVPSSQPAATPKDELEEELAQPAIVEADDSEGSTSGSSATSSFSHEIVVSSISINVLKSLGKYVYMMQVLQPILPLVVEGYMDIFKYFMYNIYTFFGRLVTNNNALEPCFPTLPSRLRKALQSVKEQVSPPAPTADGASSSSSGGAGAGAGGSSVSGASSSSSSSSSSFSSSSSSSSGGASSSSSESAGYSKALTSCLSRIGAARMNSAIKLKSKQTVFGISERATGIESLIFIAQGLSEVQEHLSHYIPKTVLPRLTAFYRDFVGVVSDLRRYLYQIFQRAIIVIDDVPHLISHNKWDSDDASPERDYVGLVAHQFTLFSAQLDDAVNRRLIPPYISEYLFKLTVQFVMEQLVEGFARVTVCSDTGRALMNLDLVTIQTHIKKVSPPPLFNKLAPFFDYCARYIKAYYLPQIEILPFVQENAGRYQSKHLIALATHASAKFPKATQQQLIHQCQLALQGGQAGAAATAAGATGSGSSTPPSRLPTAASFSTATAMARLPSASSLPASAGSNPATAAAKQSTTAASPAGASAGSAPSAAPSSPAGSAALARSSSVTSTVAGASSTTPSSTATAATTPAVAPASASLSATTPSAAPSSATAAPAAPTTTTGAATPDATAPKVPATATVSASTAAVATTPSAAPSTATTAPSSTTTAAGATTRTVPAASGTTTVPRAVPTAAAPAAPSATATRPTGAVPSATTTTTPSAAAGVAAATGVRPASGVPSATGATRLPAATATTARPGSLNSPAAAAARPASAAAGAGPVARPASVSTAAPAGTARPAAAPAAGGPAAAGRSSSVGAPVRTATAAAGAGRAVPAAAAPAAARLAPPAAPPAAAAAAAGPSSPAKFFASVAAVFSPEKKT